uniref:SMP domain-containing protein n=1 Tax=Oryza punctata TaxID=4537 RepID=A0A0E0L9G6_ORYPU
MSTRWWSLKTVAARFHLASASPIPLNLFPGALMSPPPLPDSVRAALDDVVQAVVDAVHASFIPPEGQDVDPITAAIVANAAATRASKAAHNTLSDAIAAFILSTNTDGSPPSGSSTASLSVSSSAPSATELTKAGRPSSQSTILLTGASGGMPQATSNPAHATDYGTSTSGGSSKTLQQQRPSSS